MQRFSFTATIMIIALFCLSACNMNAVATPEPTDDAVTAPGAPSDASVLPPTNITALPGSISIDTIDQIGLLNTLTGHGQRVMKVAFSAGSALLASSSNDMKIRLWDVRSGQEIHTFPMTNIDMMDITSSSDGSMLASGEAIWDVESKQELLRVMRGSQLPAHVAFSPDGSLLAVAIFFQPIQLWDVESGQVVQTIDEEVDAGTKTIEFSPDGALLAGGAHDGTIRLWDVESGEVTGRYHYPEESDIHDIAFSPDGRLLASGGRVPSAQLWDVASGELVRTLGLQEGLMGLAFSPDGTILATTGGAEHAVRLWEVESGRLLRSLEHEDQCMTVAFSPEGSLLAAGCFDNQIYLWGIPAQP